MLLWGYNEITFNGKPLALSHWSQSGIKHLSVMFNELKCKDKDGLWEKLTRNAGFIFEFQSNLFFGFFIDSGIISDEFAEPFGDFLDSVLVHGANWRKFEKQHGA